MLLQKLLKISPFVILTLLNIHVLNAQEKEGGVSGGGGDASESRVNDIRVDLLKWIDQGGAHGLKLPQSISYDSYCSGMAKVLVPHGVVVGFVTTAQEALTPRPENKVNVDGASKTCRGFVSAQDRLPHILCNTERFAGISESEQYRLIHHEYAGLAGLEQNVGASSDYDISNQITDFLVPETLLRLSVKKREPQDAPPGGSASDKAFYARTGTYSKISGTGNCPLAMEITATDGDVSSAGSDEMFKAKLKVRQITGSAVFDDDTMTQNTYETGYQWSPFYTSYRKHRIVTYLNPNSGYVVH